MATAGPLTPAWGVLEALAATRKNFDLGAAFAADEGRETRYTRKAAGLMLDVSRQCIDDAVHHALLQLPDAVGMREAIEAMWRGDPINSTERRPAWHILLRRPAVAADGAPKEFTAVLAERERMLAFAEEVHDRGQFDTVINIGIGGSDLGPAMAVEALCSLGRARPAVYFVSNVDGCALHDLLQTANPQRTLFIVCSKTFTTQETLANANTAREWIRVRLGVTAIPDHFAAISVNAAAMDDFGIDPARRFAMWDWVGGRYSVWSAVGLALAIAIGRTAFDDFLTGAYTLDEHFRAAPWDENLPVLLALVGIWNINFLKIPTLAVLPYSDRLARFPAFLQQLEMESNGKSVTHDGTPVHWETAPVIWGEPGNNAQHSFFQLLHQGSLRASVDVILLKRSPIANDHAQRLATANGLAQIETFALGQRTDDPHRVHPGARPQSVIVLEQLTPATLGALIALYEHKVYAQSVIWGINAFDQFGVELGKKICHRTLAALDSAESGGSGNLRSVRGLIEKVKST
jgi:glucose-6-phosphate isomerase